MQSFRKYCLPFAVAETDDDSCGMTVWRIVMLGVSVEKMKALNVKMEAMTLIGSGR